MRNLKYVLLTVIILIISVTDSQSFSPKGRNFGIGLMVGEPSGLTLKIWTQTDKAFALSVSNSYLGNLRLGVDYLWHYNVFNSSVANLYAGPGFAIGIGENGGWLYNEKDKGWYKDNDDIGIGVRGVVGFNLVPRNTPLEFFGEVGLMIGFLPGTFTNMEGGVGFRFYF